MTDMTDSVKVPLSLRARWIGVMLAIGAGILVSVLLMWVAPNAEYKINKSYLPLVASSHVVDPHNVQFLTPRMLAGATYTKLGTMHLTLHSLAQSLSKEHAIESAARMLAARYGGNALLIHEFGHTGQVSSRWAGYRFSAELVYVPLFMNLHR